MCIFRAQCADFPQAFGFHPSLSASRLPCESWVSRVTHDFVLLCISRQMRADERPLCFSVMVFSTFVNRAVKQTKKIWCAPCFCESPTAVAGDDPRGHLNTFSFSLTIFPPSFRDCPLEQVILGLEPEVQELKVSFFFRPEASR